MAQPDTPEDLPASQQGRTLNVKDALTYLDQVKQRFIDEPHVYNGFLDIMKLFKTQTLDTPGVIDRVSSLFRNHPALIQGFNTFLPMGYRIIMSPEDGGKVSFITVITPKGSSTVPVGSSTNLSGAAPEPAAHAPPAPMPAPPKPDPKEGIPLQVPPFKAPKDLPVTTPGAASALGIVDPKKPPVEFNHAISYVNKIKRRFHNEPDVYKQFLEILQTYQKEQRSITEVYAQVTTLFQGAPDLLQEFKQFLPDTSAPSDQSAGFFGMAAPQPQPSTSYSATSMIAPAKRAPPKPTVEPPRPKKRPGPNAAAAVPPQVPQEAPKPRKRSKPSQGASRTGPNGEISPPVQQGQFEPPAYPLAPPVSYLPPGYTIPYASLHPSHIPPKSYETNDETVFFARVAEYIDDRTTYHEFLKLLNLFTQDIIDLTTLIGRAWMFIGSADDIWADFKDLVGWVDGLTQDHNVIENGRLIIDNVPVHESRMDMSKLKAHGPSYRQIPATNLQLNCSGRDALCWEVLNDEWVSNMTSISEDGFIAHRKNPFEEALHRSEEERHEYDYHIEANLRTIGLLEPIASRIAQMDHEERLSFRLKPGLGGQSKSIYQRIIKKVYGKEQGLEVIQALHENPCLAVPIVLARLKQKDEEWKRALREWNRVWRDIDSKNFYKSLDHQGIIVKTADKKQLSLKSLVSEIELLRREQQIRKLSHQARLSANRPRKSPSLRYQLQYEMPQENLLYDALRLVLMYIDRTPVSNSVLSEDRQKVADAIKTLAAFIFCIPKAVAFARLAPPPPPAPKEDEYDDVAEGSDTGSAMGAGTTGDESAGPYVPGRRGRRPGFGAGGDLRRRAVKRGVRRGRGGNSGRFGQRRPGQDDTEGEAMDEDLAPGSRDTSPVPQAATDVENGIPPDENVEDEDVQMTDAPAIVVEQTSSAASVAMEPSESTAASVGTPAADGETSILIPTSRPSPPLSPLPDTKDLPETDKITVSEAAQAQQAQQDEEMREDKPEVPATAAGLEGMQGVDIISAPANLAPLEQTELSSQATSTDIPIANQTESTNPDQQMQDAAPAVEEKPAEPEVPVIPQFVDPSRRYNFFCNSAYYGILRLIQLLYSRLETIHATAQTLATPDTNKPAMESFNTAKNGLPIQGSLPDAQVAYDKAIALCRRYFNNEMGSDTFEDSLRAIFGNKAYPLYTVDKVANSIIKLVQSTMDASNDTASICEDIMACLEKDRTVEDPSNRQQIAYREQIESIIGSESNLYRVEWVVQDRKLVFQLLGKDDIIPEDETKIHAQWEAYIQSYLQDDFTADVTLPSKSRILLKRTMPKDQNKVNLRYRTGLQTRICMRTLRMFYQGKTEDWSVRDYTSSITGPDVRTQKKQRFDKWAQQQFERASVVTMSDVRNEE